MKNKIPTREECIKILKENKVPRNIIDHSKKVSEVALKISDILEKRGIKVNRKLVEAAALLHDVEKLKKDHVVKGYQFLINKGFKEVAEVAIKHGLEHIRDKKLHPLKVEDKIVFYSDKRVLHDKVVKLEKRFEYIHKRYGYDIGENIKFIKKIEQELLEGESIE